MFYFTCNHGLKLISFLCGSSSLLLYFYAVVLYVLYWPAVSLFSCASYCIVLYSSTSCHLTLSSTFKIVNDLISSVLSILLVIHHVH